MRMLYSPSGHDICQFEVLKIDRGAHPALADPSQILSDPRQKSKVRETFGIDSGGPE